MGLLSWKAAQWSCMGSTWTLESTQLGVPRRCLLGCRSPSSSSQFLPRKDSIILPRQRKKQKQPTELGGHNGHWRPQFSSHTLAFFNGWCKITKLTCFRFPWIFLEQPTFPTQETKVLPMEHKLALKDGKWAGWEKSGNRHDFTALSLKKVIARHWSANVLEALFSFNPAKIWLIHKVAGFVYANEGFPGLHCGLLKQKWFY